MDIPDPAAWNRLYESADTPWDLGGPHPELVGRVEELGAPGDAFVGGAGRAHDALALARGGWQVVATDWAPDAASAADELAALGSQYLVSDSLTFDDGPFDLIFEHTFFCAIDPTQRPAYAVMADRLLRPGGRLAAIVFPVGKQESSGGPPWGISTAVLGATLGPRFELVIDEPVGRRGRSGWNERWAVWRAR